MEEGKVPIEVRDTGGETLVHHAAYHGQVNLMTFTVNQCDLTIITRFYSGQMLGVAVDDHTQRRKERYMGSLSSG